MRVSTLLSTAVLATSVTAAAIEGRFSCGAPEPDEAFKAAAREMDNDVHEDSLMAITVDTYFHVVAASTRESDGYLSDSTVNRQLRVMNDDFRASNFQFNLLGTTRTVNRNWASDGNEIAMKQALRRGDYKTLNVYFLGSLRNFLGYCYFPTNASPGSNAFIRDGCTVLGSTVPGGSSAPFNLGKTATHEVGHWMGLFHTFQGGCTGGDSVSDTPAQRSPSSGCPVGRDSCPNQPGLDPITNYMDYSDDRCYEEFTPGQASRMLSMWNRYRA